MPVRLSLSSALAVGSLTLAAALLVSACGRQGEGERCVLANGNLDCNADLECKPSSSLRFGADGVSRCCPTTGYNDDLCTPGKSGGSGGSSNGSGGQNAGGEGGGAQGGGELGSACDYNSDCEVPLICGPQGRCQNECQQDRDCQSGFVCSANLVCVAE